MSPFWDILPIKRNDNSLGIIDPEFNKKKIISPKLPIGYSFIELDLNDNVDMSNTLKFLQENYVTDISITEDYIRWKLLPPLDKFDFLKDKSAQAYKFWTIGILTSKTDIKKVKFIEPKNMIKHKKKIEPVKINPEGRAKDFHEKQLVGFIAGCPCRYIVNEDTIEKQIPVETFTIDMLCVHRDLRKQKLSTVLIKELFKRLQILEMLDGTIVRTKYVIPNCYPVSSPMVYVRPLNIEKLVSTGKVKSAEEANKLKELLTLKPSGVLQNFKEIAEKDISEALDLYLNALHHYHMGCIFSYAEFEHYFLKFPNLVSTFIVRDPISGEVTELISFYTLYTAGGKQAHLFHIVSNNIPSKILVTDVMNIAQYKKYDYFFILDVYGIIEADTLFEKTFIQDKIEKNYYLFNYNTYYTNPSNFGLLLPTIV